MRTVRPLEVRARQAQLGEVDQEHANTNLAMAGASARGEENNGLGYLNGKLYLTHALPGGRYPAAAAPGSRPTLSSTSTISPSSRADDRSWVEQLRGGEPTIDRTTEASEQRPEQ